MSNSPSHSNRLIIAIIFLTLASAGVAGAQATISKVFTPNTIGPDGVSTATFTITNGSASPVTALAFTDNLPAAITIADPANASTSCDLGSSGSLTAPDGGSTITLANAQIGAFQACTVTVDVTASTPGVHTNPAITLTSSSGSSMSVAVDLTVDVGRPGFSKSFAPSSVPLGARSTLTFTIDNSLNTAISTNLAFGDLLPTGMVVADPSNAATDCVFFSAPIVTAVPGSGFVGLASGGVAATTTCTVTVDVLATGAGLLDNVSSELVSFQDGSVGKASATLEVTVTPLALQKSFTDDPVPPGGTAILEFTIDNFDRNFSATDVAFTDDLTTLVPALAGLTSSSLLSNDCGGSVTGVGTSLITLSGGTVSAEGSCTIRVGLTVPAGAAPGSYTNTTSAITGTVGGSPVVGNMASDDLYVEPVPLLTKEFIGDPVIPGDTVVLEFTVTNTSPTSNATDIAFQDLFDSVLATASVTPGDGCCGAGSTCSFSPLIDPGSDSGVIPATLSISGASLAPAGMAGDSCTFSITLDVSDDAASGSYPNTTTEITATVDGATRTGDPASDTLTVIAAPNLTKEFTDDPVAPGDTVTLEFTLSYSADATGDATAITFTDDLTFLAGLTATGLPLAEACDPDGPGGDAGTGTLSESGGVLTFMGGTLSPGESCTFIVSLDVTAGAAPGRYTNTTSGVAATVEGLAAASAPAEDDLKVAGLVFTKEFLGDPVIPGDAVTLRFTIDNIHPTDDATITFFTDDLQADLPGLAATGPPSVNECGGALSGTTSLTYVGGSVMSGMDCDIEVEVLVPAGAADGTYVNTTSSLTATQSGAVTVDPATDELIVNSNLIQLTKSFTDDPVAPGDPVTLEFTLTNLDAGLAASNIDFSDALGAALAGLTFDSVLFDDCGGTVSGTGTDMMTVTGASLGVGGSCTLRVSLTVPGGAAAGIYPNTTSAVSGDIGGFTVSGDAASDDLEVIQLLLFSKSFDGPTTATGIATLTFTITNPGNETATDIYFSDDLDDVIPGLIAISLPALPCGAGASITGISFLAFTGGELPPMGGMCSFDVDVLVPATATAGAFPNITSELFSQGLTVSDPATADLVVEPPPTFAKEFLPDAILAGGGSTLRFTVNNSASALAASGLAFTDNLPAGVVIATPSVASSSCGGTLTATGGAGVISLTGGSVGAGATCTIDVDVTSIISGMHANATGDLTSSSGSSGTATDTLTVSSAADLSVTKTDGVTSATPGGSVIYTIVAANAGPSFDPAVSLADTFSSPPLTCTYTSVGSGGATGNTAAGAGDLAETLSMPAGSSVTYSVSCAIDSDATGTLSNTATVVASVTDLVPGNNSATDGDTVLAPSADLSITKTDGVTSAVPGQTTLTYTIVASNNGLSDDPSVAVSDTFPAALSCTYTSVAAGGATGNTATGSGDLSETLSMPAGSSVTYTVGCTIDAAATGTLSNTATITASVTDPVPGNNSATDDDTVLAPEADLSITKTDGVTSAVPGQTTLTYTIVASSSGPSADPAATVTDAFPAELSCTYTSVASGGATGNTAAGSGDLAETLSLPVGSSVTYTADCTIDAAATGTLSNTATIAASVTDPAPGNDSATDDDTVLAPEADLSITKTASDDPVFNPTFSYTLEVTNDGPSDADGVEATDVLPAGVVFDSSADGCTEAAGTVTCAFGTIADGVTMTRTFAVALDPPWTGSISNTASVSSDNTDPNMGNNDSTVETTLDDVPPETTEIATAAGPLAECDTVRDLVTSLSVTIVDDLAMGAGADDPANYLLVGAGPDADFSTFGCAAGVTGDDVPIEIVALSLTTVDPVTVNARLGLGGALDAGLYRLLVCDTITDTAGNALDGDGDMNPGGDFVLPFFRVDPFNLFANGHFDDCPVTLDPWSILVTAPNAVLPGLTAVEDSDDSPFSASAWLSNSTADPTVLAQCVPVGYSSPLDIRARVRFLPTTSEVATFQMACEFFDGASCGGASLGVTSAISVLEDEGGAWLFLAADMATPSGTASARCDFAFEAVGASSDFDLYIDGLFVGSGSVLFTDGFESGDVSAWSSSNP